MSSTAQTPQPEMNETERRLLDAILAKIGPVQATLYVGASYPADMAWAGTVATFDTAQKELLAHRRQGEALLLPFVRHIAHESDLAVAANAARRAAESKGVRFKRLSDAVPLTKKNTTIKRPRFGAPAKEAILKALQGGTLIGFHRAPNATTYEPMPDLQVITGAGYPVGVSEDFRQQALNYIDELLASPEANGIKVNGDTFVCVRDPNAVRSGVYATFTRHCKKVEPPLPKDLAPPPPAEFGTPKIEGSVPAEAMDALADTPLGTGQPAEVS